MATPQFVHPVLFQESTAEAVLEATAPFGVHTQVNEDDIFPHIDENGLCWVPDGFAKENLADEEGVWADYQDSQSEVMRAECDTQPWLDICNISLYWLEVQCDVYTAKNGGVAEEDNTLPYWIVIITQIFAVMWEFNIVSIVTFPWWALLLVLAIVDWILDWVWIGLFAWWCEPCAITFIWIINIIMIPFHVGGWLQRFRLETFGLIVDGWMLFFGGSGCYLGFGEHCWGKDSNYRTIWDIPIMNKENDDGTSIAGELKSYFVPPSLTDPYESLKVKQAHRTDLLSQQMPGYTHLSGAYDYLVDYLEL